MNKNSSDLISAVSKAPMRIILGAFLFISAALIMSKAFSVILGISGIPYNVRELFLDKGSFARLFIFSSSILWPGLSAALIISGVSKSRFPFVTLPFLVGLSGLFSYWLLAQSVTNESISDIVGSSNIWWFVMNKHIWGDWGVTLFKAIGSSDLVNLIERHVRYLALYCPIVFFVVICSAGTEKLFLLERIKAVFYVSLVSFPWLMLSKIIAFDYSSTDNLNELIAGDVGGEMGGGVYLYLLLLLIVSNSVYISKNTGRQIYKYVLMIVITIIAAPIAWYFLKTGLVTDFKKYDVAYSGVDFLLGPDRKTKLPESVLFLRWSFVYISAVFFLAYGQLVFLIGKILMKDRTSVAVVSVKQEISQSTFMKIWWVICFLIAYGSFFPFHFYFDIDQSIRGLNDLLSVDFRFGLSDIVSNIVLFLPFGFFGKKAIGEMQHGFRIILISGIIFSFVLQVLQIFIPARVSSFTDVIWNTVGCVSGIVSTRWIKFEGFNDKNGHHPVYFSVPIIIAACWLISQLIPFVPSLDIGEIKNSIKPLLVYHEFSWLSCLKYMVSWLVFGSLVFSVYHPRRSNQYLCLLICFVLCLQVIIMTRVLTISSLSGAFLAMAVWILFFDGRGQKNWLFLVMAALYILINGIFPFDMANDFVQFRFIPFHGFLTGNMLYNTIKLFEKIFIYGSLVIFLRKIPVNRIFSVSIGFLWVLFIEILQIFSTNHSPEITDPLMVILITIAANSIERNKTCTINL